jgi:hypothetical protein
LQGVRSGRKCVEILVLTRQADYIGFGFAVPGVDLSSYLGRDDKGWSFQATREQWHSNSSSRYGEKYIDGDVLACEVDLDDVSVDVCVWCERDMV